MNIKKCLTVLSEVVLSLLLVSCLENENTVEQAEHRYEYQNQDITSTEQNVTFDETRKHNTTTENNKHLQQTENNYPIITKELVTELLHKIHDAMYRMNNFGFTEDSSAWYADKSKYIHRFKNDQPFGLMSHYSLVQFAPELDTVEKFDSCFLQIFTGETLENEKKHMGFRVFNGKVYGMGVNPTLNHITDWDKTEVLSIEQSEDGIFASAKIRLFTDNPRYSRGNCKETVCYFNFVFSKEFGWRFNGTTPSYAQTWYFSTGYPILQEEISAEEFSQELLQTMPPIAHPEGYKDTALSAETAQGIIQEAKRLYEMAKFSGLSKQCRSWEGNIDNRVPVPGFEEDFELAKYGAGGGLYLTKFIPPLDTTEEFDAYFLQIFNPDTLDLIKQECGICEYEGVLAGNNFLDCPYGTFLDHDADEIAFFEQNGNTAVLGINKYGGLDETEFFKCIKYIFEYSDEYGWRVSVSKSDYDSYAFWGPEY